MTFRWKNKEVKRIKNKNGYPYSFGGKRYFFEPRHNQEVYWELNVYTGNSFESLAVENWWLIVIMFLIIDRIKKSGFAYK